MIDARSPAGVPCELNFDGEVWIAERTDVGEIRGTGLTAKAALEAFDDRVVEMASAGEPINSFAVAQVLAHRDLLPEEDLRQMSYSSPSGIACYSMQDDDGTWAVGNTSLRLHGYGDTPDEAMVVFEERVRGFIAAQSGTLDILGRLSRAAAQLNSADAEGIRPMPLANRCLFCGWVRSSVRTLLGTDNGATICNFCVEAAVPQIGEPGEVISLFGQR